ncbi:MAG: PD-(D/E)XK nuclease family protein [Acidiferrobacter sp.]
MVRDSGNEFTAEFWQRAGPGAVIVTANNRLSRRLLQVFAAYRTKDGTGVWEAPDILPWPAFVAREADRLRAADGFTHVALTATQERWIWRQIVAPYSAGWLGADADFAALAMQAWRLLGDYRLASPPVTDEAEGQVFHQMARDFAQRLGALARDDAAFDAARLAAAYEDRRIAAPTTLIWVGFQTLTPAQAAIATMVSACGGHSRQEPLPHRQTTPQAFLWPTQDAEFDAALCWAQDQVRRHPHRHYALIVPDLDRHRRALDRRAEEILGPGGASFSLGVPLIDVPAVATAWHVVALLFGPLTQAEAVSLVQSPFLGGFQDEPVARLRAAQQLTEGAATIDLAALTAHVRGAGARRLVRELEALARVFPRQRRPVRPSLWAGLFARALQAVGWPAGAESADFQAAAAVDTTLAAIAGLDGVAASLPVADAARWWCEELQQTIFQPAAPPAPVSIMGPLEAIGLTFDGLWLANLHDRVWPPPSAPHPLLPIAWQRRHRLPHADPVADLAYTATLMDHLLQAAPQTVASAALSTGEGPLRPSPLIRERGLAPGSADPWVSRARRQFEARVPLERMPVVRVPLAASSVWGLGVIGAQAACPFKAFAQYRLRAQPPVSAPWGLSPRVRGTILHRALEGLFGEIVDSSRLADRAACQDAIVAAVATAMAEAEAAFAAQPARFRALETRRYEALLESFLEQERRRPHFAVRAREQEVTLTLGPLTLRGRIDRIDEEEHGDWVLIDYKTGALPRLDTPTDERPLHPQLMLYALAAGGPVAAMVYAAVQPGGCQYRGYSRDEGLLPRVRALPTWALARTHWQQVFTGLAGEFADGEARVTPAVGACDYCGREALCRIGSGGAERAGDDDE